MMNLCCTKAFLKRLKRKPDVHEPSGSVLGDWYAKEVRSGSKRYFAFMSNRTGISLILPARMHDLEVNFRQHLGLVLYKVHAPAIAVREELAQAAELNFTVTADRSALGCLNEIVFQCQWFIADKPLITAEELEESVFKFPLGGPNYWFPAEDTRKLLTSHYQS